MNTQISYLPIGIIKTPFSEISNMPIQPTGAAKISGIIELNPEFASGLKDLDGFSHIILLYHLHRITGYKLSVVPFMDDKSHGIFATRSPARPNPIGISIVELLKVEGNRLFIEGVDMLNETPLLDIKPFFSKFDNRAETRSGWLEEKKLVDIITVRSDQRFEK
ncbi:MAG: tRNA (N6-threonylcarbamoyladenosine(37)-N6)-methyltransferase TrmO [Prolixibacteraceae bacterium]|jgi:tRNA-Thr(GGU) m(6)t(6)A37 methyltransferase TsaA